MTFSQALLCASVAGKLHVSVCSKHLASTADNCSNHNLRSCDWQATRKETPAGVMQISANKQAVSFTGCRQSRAALPAPARQASYRPVSASAQRRWHCQLLTAIG